MADCLALNVTDMCMLRCRPAERVEVEDTLLAASSFDLVEGSLQHTYPSIPAGRSVEFQYVVVPKARQQGFLAPAARVKYSNEGQSRQRTLLSSTPYVPVLSKTQYLEIFLVKLVRFACPHRSATSLMVCCNAVGMPCRCCRGDQRAPAAAAQ